MSDGADPVFWGGHIRTNQIAALVVCVLLLTSCAGYEGALEYTTEVITYDRRMDDDRDYVPAWDRLGNLSNTDTIEVLSVTLDGGVGLELVEAFSTEREDSQINGYVPPRPGDYANSEEDASMLDNWEKRVPVSETIVEPGDLLSLVLVLHPTTDDTCVYTVGYTIKYRQRERTYSQYAKSAFVFIRGEDSDLYSVCPDVVDRIDDRWAGIQ